MIWVTWRQYRTQILVALGALAALAVIVLLTGPNLAHLYDTTVATCKTHNDCSAARSSFLLNDVDLQTALDVLVTVVPGILGIFWGAPLIARELESGTYRLAWTQSVTRNRWLTVKVGVIGLASMVVAGLLSLMVTWWFIPLDRVTMSPFESFDERDIVPVAYAAFAFTLGATAGAIIRRSVPTMATTLVAFASVRLAVALWLRPNLIAPVLRVIPLSRVSVVVSRVSVVASVSANGGTPILTPNTPTIPNAWIYSVQIVNRAGHLLSTELVGSACPDLASDPRPNVVGNCVAKLSAKFHVLVTYQPGSRYWAFQWYELAIFVAAAVVLAAICFWWIRRRLA
jgi:hypothetical protein